MNSLNLSFTLDSWAGHHSRVLRCSQNKPGKNCVFSLIPQLVLVLDMQCHCMQIIKNTVTNFYPDQTSVAVSGQPAFVLTKQRNLDFPTSLVPKSTLQYLEVSILTPVYLQFPGNWRLVVVYMKYRKIMSFPILPTSNFRCFIFKVSRFKVRNSGHSDFLCIMWLKK